MSDLPRRIGAAIRESREAQHISLRRLSAMTGVRASYIPAIESGSVAITTETLGKIADALKLQIAIK